MNRSDPHPAGGEGGGGGGPGDLNANLFPHRNRPPQHHHHAGSSADDGSRLLRWEETEESRDESAAAHHGIRLARSTPPPPFSSLSAREAQPQMRILPSDVLCGRGKASYNHAGNMRFRDSITTWLPRYRDAVHLFDKALIVDAVIGDVRRSGGRFLRYDHFASRAVNELSEHQIKEKVGRALRDAVAAGEATRKAAARRRRRRSSGSAETRADREDFPKAAPLPQPDAPSSHRAVPSHSSAPRRIHRAGARDSRGLTEPPAAASAVATAVAAAEATSDDAHEQFVAAINSVLGPAQAEEAAVQDSDAPGRRDSTDESDPFHHHLC